MKYWSRDNTRDWISQLETRIEDFNFYLNEATRYCDQHEISDDKEVLALSIMTCIWVASMRNEKISLSEVIDILNLEMELISDKTYDLCEQMSQLDFEQMLEIVSRKGPFLGLNGEA